MSTIAKVVSLLPIFLAEYQEFKLITELNRFFHFDHNIFLLDASVVDIHRFVNKQEDIPQSVYVFKKIGDFNTIFPKIKIQTKNTFMVVVAKHESKSNFLLVGQGSALQTSQTTMKFGMFFSNFVSSEDLQVLFKLCKRLLLVNIFVATYAYPNVIQGVTSERLLNIFTFHPFGTLRNVTSVDSYASYFPSLNSNFQQNELRLAKEFGGYFDKELWPMVFKLMNASFTFVSLIIPQDAFFWPRMEQNEIDIIPQTIETVEFFKKYQYLQMYPMRMESHVIIVPEAEPYSGFSAYLRTLTSDKFFVYSSITIPTIMLLLIVIRYIKQKKILFVQSVADILNLLVNDNGYVKYQRLSLVEVFIIVPLTFVGLIFVNGILSSLQSYITRPVLQPQIETIEDIYRSPFAIHTASELSRNRLIVAFSNQTEYEDWNKTIFALETKQFLEQLYMYNTSKSFFTNISNVNTLLEVQKRLNIRGFHITQIPIPRSLVNYIVLEKFLFFERLNEIVHRINSAGLYDLWMRRDTSMSKQYLLKLNVERLKNQSENIVENFEFPIIVVYGWLLSVIVFFIEFIWEKIKLSRIKFRRIGIDQLRKLCLILAEKLKR